MRSCSFAFPLHGRVSADLHHLMLPVEVRIQPHLQGSWSDLGLIDTYPGLILPLIASATATLLFRQFFPDHPR